MRFQFPPPAGRDDIQARHSALCAPLRRLLPATNGLKNGIGGRRSRLDSAALSGSCKHGARRRRCSPVVLPSSMARPRLQANIFIAALRRWNSLRRVQYKWRRLATKAGSLLWWLAAAPARRCGGADVSGRDGRANHSPERLFGSAQRLLQAAITAGCGSNVSEITQGILSIVFTAPPPLPPPTLCGRMAIEGRRCPGAGSSSATCSKVRREEMAAFRTLAVRSAAIVLSLLFFPPSLDLFNPRVFVLCTLHFCA